MKKIGSVGIAVAVLVFIVLLGWYINDYVMHPMEIVNCTDDPNEVNKNQSIYPCNITDNGEAELVPDEPYKVPQN